MNRTSVSALKAMVTEASGRELEVGLALLSLTRDDLEALGCQSLTELIQRRLLGKVERPDYSSVMRWVRAAEVLDGLDDPQRGWGVSQLIELARIADPASRADFVARCGDASRMPIRELRRRVTTHLANDAVRRVSHTPEAILQRAVTLAVERLHPGCRGVQVRLRRPHGGDARQHLEVATPVLDDAAAEALATAARVTGEVGRVRGVWRPAKGRPTVDPPPPSSLDEVLALPPGQLEASWVSPDLVELRKAGTPMLHLSVERCPPIAGGIIYPHGNTKTGTECGIVNTISQGCLRAATGLPGTHEACYVGPDNPHGCFANYTRVAQRHSSLHFDVARNGLVNDCLRIRLPKSGRRSLAEYDQDLWRVDSESADGSLSIALGLLQSWAEANPRHWMFTICSHAVRPSDGMLAWLAALQNTWAGHTVSAAFSPREVDVRFDAIRRFVDWGIPSVVWIATRVGWENEAVLERVRGFVPDELIIESPYRRGPWAQELPLLGANPLGACSDHRTDGANLEYDLAAPPEEMPRRMPLNAHAHCTRCRLRCGLVALQALGRLAPH